MHSFRTTVKYMSSFQKEYEVSCLVSSTDIREMKKKPFLVCVHGIFGTSEDFLYMIDKMSEEYIVVSIDMPGRGCSDWLNDQEDYNYFTYVSVLDAVVKEYCPSSFNYIGISMGGLIGMFFASNNLQSTNMKSMILDDIGPIISFDSIKHLTSPVYYKKYNTFGEALSSMEEIYGTIDINYMSLEEKQSYISSLIAKIGNAMNRSIDERQVSYGFGFDPKILDQLRQDIIDNVTGSDIDLTAFWLKIRDDLPILVLKGGKSIFLSDLTLQYMLDSGKNVKANEYPNSIHPVSLFFEDRIEFIRNWLKSNPDLEEQKMDITNND